MISVFPKGLKTPRANKLENITLRGFGGGWNAIETDMQMESSYLVTVRNFRRTPGGTQRVRFGSKWVADLSNLISGSAFIVDMEYFAGRLVCVISNGQIATIDDAGATAIIWSSAIAAALPGAPSGWHTNIDSVDFVAFKHDLILHNGIDKPITIADNFTVTYLQDLASGSNIHTPIGKYGCVVQNYHCVGGIPASPTQIYISAVGTAGTFLGDPIPNDSITIDVGAYAPEGAVDIRGIAGFRGNLLIFFEDQTVVSRLGDYTAAGVHKPSFLDAIPTFGLLGHRSFVSISNDLVYAGLSGVTGAQRSLISVSNNSTIQTNSLSERIEPVYQKVVGNLTNDQQLKQCWMVYDILHHDVLLFTPSGPTFVYSFNPKLKYASWSEYSDLNVQCGCKSFLGRIFYADGLRVYQHGNKTFANETFEFDRELDRDATWTNGAGFAADKLVLDTTNGNVYKCLMSHISSALPATFASDRLLVPPMWEPYLGKEITFQLELPWLDSKDPMKVKQLRFISMATKGNAEFTVSAYVDNLFKDRLGNIIFGPCLSTDFIGNEALGFGYDEGPYGGGRRSDDPRLFKFPVKFKKLKLTVHGMSGGDLELVNMSFLFSRGRYRR